MRLPPSRSNRFGWIRSYFRGWCWWLLLVLFVVVVVVVFPNVGDCGGPSSIVLSDTTAAAHNHHHRRHTTTRLLSITATTTTSSTIGIRKGSGETIQPYHHHHHHQHWNSFLPTVPSFILHSPQLHRVPFVSDTSPSSTTTNRVTTKKIDRPNYKVIIKAWTCHGRNQRDMVHQLQQAGIIRSPQVLEVMSLVDRRNFFPATSQMSPNHNHHYYYEDAPYPIGYGQTISAPHMHAYVLEEIITHLSQTNRITTSTGSPSRNMTTNNNNNNTTTIPEQTPSSRPLLQFLDVGCGSGYITACFGRWLSSSSPPDPTNDTITTDHNNNNNNNNNGTTTGHDSSSILGVSGYAYGIDIVPELVNLTRANIGKQDSDLLLPPAVTIVAVSDRPHDDDPSVVDHAVTGEMRNHHANTEPLPESPPSPPPQSTVTIQLGNGYHGLPQYAPFDIIHVGAAAITFPFTLCQQLKVGGLLIVPVHDHDDQQNHPRQHHLNSTKSQTLYKIERLSDKNQPPPSPLTLMFDHRTGPTPTNHDTPPPSCVATYEFDHNEYRITPLLGVRYVPLVLE